MSGLGVWHVACDPCVLGNFTFGFWVETKDQLFICPIKDRDGMYKWGVVRVHGLLK